MGDATISLHPAGHILGSAQVRIEVAGQVALITGDYKLQADPTCSAWEPQRCDLLVTESTFGLPVFRWPSTEQVIDEIAGWWQENQLAGRTSVLLAYSVGKSQRIIAELLKKLGSEAAHEMAVHGALRGPNRAYVAAGVVLPDLPSAASMPSDHDWSRSLILAPPSSQSTPWMQRFSDPSIAMASGWMAIRGTRRRRGVERGFILSDHIDWPDLLQAIGVCKPQQVWVTHGFTDIVARFLAEQGIPACVLETKFQGDDAEGTQESEQAPESAP